MTNIDFDAHDTDLDSWPRDRLDRDRLAKPDPNHVGQLAPDPHYKAPDPFSDWGQLEFTIDGEEVTWDIPTQASLTKRFWRGAWNLFVMGCFGTFCAWVGWLFWFQS